MKMYVAVSGSKWNMIKEKKKNENEYKNVRFIVKSWKKEKENWKFHQEHNKRIEFYSFVCLYTN